VRHLTAVIDPGGGSTPELVFDGEQAVSQLSDIFCQQFPSYEDYARGNHCSTFVACDLAAGVCCARHALGLSGVEDYSSSLSEMAHFVGGFRGG
jgi:hypothetical protein